MRKQFNFGKIDYLKRGRKINAVDVTMTLSDDVERPVLTVSGHIWNQSHTDVWCGGQCLDEIAKTSIGKNSTFMEIYRLWDLYHLNDMHAGTPKQEEFLKRAHASDAPHTYHDYDADCKLLEAAGLLEDNGYTYGHGWLYEAIPAEDLAKIKKLLEE